MFGIHILTNKEKESEIFKYTPSITYYLYTDRLGSGSAVTDGRGEAVHMPYGDTLLDLSKRRLRDALRVCRIHKLYLILYEFLSTLFHLDIEQNNKINGRY